MRCEKFDLEIRTVELKKNFGAPPYHAASLTYPFPAKYPRAHVDETNAKGRTPP